MRNWLIAGALMAAASTLSPQIIPPGSFNQTPGVGQQALVLPALSVGEVSFVETGKLTLSLGPDLTAATSVLLIAKQKVPAVSFYVTLRRSAGQVPCAGSVTTLTGATALMPEQKVSLPIEVTGCGATSVEGVIGILGSSGQAHEREIALTRTGSRHLSWDAGLSLGLALLLTAASAVVARLHGHKMGDVIGDASWDFSSSWASNITAFATAFAFVTQLSVFPVKPFTASRSEYMFISLFAAALVALAPAVQRAAGSADVTAAAGVPAVTTHGLVGGFLLASTFTLWGAFLQFGTQLLILDELAGSATVSLVIANSVRSVIVLSCLGLAVYGVRAMLTRIGGNASRSAAPSGAMNLAAFQNPALTAAQAQARKIAVL